MRGHGTVVSSCPMRLGVLVALAALVLVLAAPSSEGGFAVHLDVSASAVRVGKPVQVVLRAYALGARGRVLADAPGRRLRVEAVSPARRITRVAVDPVESDARIPIELDGETPGRLPAVFEILPAALRVRL